MSEPIFGTRASCSAANMPMPLPTAPSLSSPMSAIQDGGLGAYSAPSDDDLEALSLKIKKSEVTS